MPSESALWLPPLSPKNKQRIDRQLKRQQRNYFAWTGFQGKTFWDFLQLLAALAIPVAVAIGTAWFSAAQSQASAIASQKQHETDVQIAQDQQQETALQNYLDHLSDLLLNDHLRKSKLGEEVRNVARVRTLIVLPQLNGTRKREVINFLYEAGLIDAQSGTVISLKDADLSGAILSHANLSFADLSGAILSHASLGDDNLSHANLSHANLMQTDLSSTELDQAELSYANLSGANLIDADLNQDNLSHANLSGALMPDGSKHP